MNPDQYRQTFGHAACRRPDIQKETVLADLAVGKILGRPRPNSRRRHSLHAIRGEAVGATSVLPRRRRGRPAPTQTSPRRRRIRHAQKGGNAVPFNPADYALLHVGPKHGRGSQTGKNGKQQQRETQPHARASAPLRAKGRSQRRKRPRPALEATWPFSHTISPREMVTTGQPLTCIPS